MRPTSAHIAKRTGRLAALSILIAGLAGCQSIAGSQQFSQIRFIDASPDAPALDIYQNASVGLYNIGFGTVSSYIPVAPGTYVHAAYTAGTQQELATVRGNFATGVRYTVLAGNVAANLHMTVLKDQATPAPAGEVALRVLDQSTSTGAVDIYLLPAGSGLAGLAPVATDMSFGGNTGYIDAPSGTYSIVALPAGTVPISGIAPLYTGSQVSYNSGSARTIILIDQQPASTPGLQAITADDYDPSSFS